MSVHPFPSPAPAPEGAGPGPLPGGVVLPLRRTGRAAETGAVRALRYPNRFAEPGTRVVGALALAPRTARAPVPALVPPPADPADLRRVTLLVVEVLGGARAPQQLGPRVTGRVYASLPLPAAGRSVRVPKVRRWRMQQPRPGVAEVTALVQSHGRCHALALRFAHGRRGWLCTTIETTLPLP